MHFTPLKKSWLSRAIIFGFGALFTIAFPLFCRFTATALDNSNTSNILAGVTGVFVTILGLPLMVIAFHRRRPRDLLWDLQDSRIGCWLTTLTFIIVPSQFGWYFFREIYLPRCGDGPLSLCTPVLIGILMSAALSIASIGALIYVFLIEPYLPRLRRLWQSQSPR